MRWFFSSVLFFICVKQNVFDLKLLTFGVDWYHCSYLEGEEVYFASKSCCKIQEDYSWYCLHPDVFDLLLHLDYYVAVFLNWLLEERRKHSLFQCINWPTGGVLCPKLFLVCISSSTVGPKGCATLELEKSKISWLKTIHHVRLFRNRSILKKKYRFINDY